MKYEKPMLFSLEDALTSEGFSCFAGGKNGLNCTNGTGATNPGCSSGTYAYSCSGGSSANGANCVTGEGANARCSNGSQAGFACSTGTST
jgi:hypothetical protein